MNVVLWIAVIALVAFIGFILIDYHKQIKLYEMDEEEEKKCEEQLKNRK